MVVLPILWLTYQLGSSESPDINNTEIVCQLMRLNYSKCYFLPRGRDLAHEIFKEISKPCIFWC